jgi:phospholipase C
MSNIDRRKFLQVLSAGAISTALPGSISKALAIPANNRTARLTMWNTSSS